MQNRLPTLLTSLAIGITFAGAALVLIGSEAKARPMTKVLLDSNEPAPVANPRIKAVFDDAKNPLLTPNARKQLVTRVRELIEESQLKVGVDYSLAADVVAKGETLEDAMLSHDLAVCALALGDSQAKSLIAVSQDLILARLGQKQRFGTKHRDGTLDPVNREVSDSMRRILGLPSLREAKRLVALGKPFVPLIGSTSTGVPMMQKAAMMKVSSD